MATVIVRFVFSDSKDKDSAEGKIRDVVGREGISGWSTSIEIDDSCKEPSKAAEICRTYGGRVDR